MRVLLLEPVEYGWRTIKVTLQSLIHIGGDIFVYLDCTCDWGEYTCRKLI